MFAPLFGHQYSHVWIDFKGIQDSFTRARGIDYFENSRRASLAHRAYATANPGAWRGYADSVWGLTASDGPLDSSFVLLGRQRQFHTYWARGAGTDEINDDGTIAPTAAGGSVPFAPEVAIPALVAMRRQYGDALFGRYGFVDAFNPSLTDGVLRVSQGRIEPGVGWFDTDYLGIDQGPILLMIENQRTQLVWRLMRGIRTWCAGCVGRVLVEGGWRTSVRECVSAPSCHPERAERVEGSAPRRSPRALAQPRASESLSPHAPTLSPPSAPRVRDARRRTLDSRPVHRRRAGLPL